MVARMRGSILIPEIAAMGMVPLVILTIVLRVILYMKFVRTVQNLGMVVRRIKILIAKRLEVGSLVDTLDDVFDLYTEYGRFNGFSVRKGTQRPDEDAPWKVRTFAKKHNHELLKHSESYLLRSARKMSDGKKRLIVGMKSSGIGVSKAFRFMENEAGGRQNVGFTRNDVYNELDRENRKMCRVDNADANKLVEYLTEKGLTEPSFYWKVKLSDDCRLEHLFYRDSRCLIDYQHFGDVVFVDATYKTNKYDLMCVPIVGMNHHRSNVMFGIALLSNERTESYQWLFRTFLEAMYQKEPSIIFSDQDQALMNSVDLTFRQSSHRLCQWHINKNAVRHFGKLNCDADFKSLWYRCMNGCENGEQFESTWSSMIGQHGLAKNKWFCTMYNLRRRWSSAFTRDKFSGGLHATSRSEVTNRVLKELCKSTSSLHAFVVGFERMQKTWRTGEFEEDALNRGRRGMFVQHTSL
ncbi:protein FAR1-RELATED SEQUENCE 5-like [Salvia miltiorrhiza]|uniref:protein FAR1-RELATED SEQUENCE 5-like n=1 Tax=Salvia miltiorrhiza TaxID=226208 RepID=UPI0025AC26D0|nr:protein FAR1-RELATED SEQUENCE 5-like [Salvia miltiorrhiza]